MLRWRKRIAAGLAACLCLGTALPKAGVRAEEDAVMGRYVEQEVELPDIFCMDVKTLPDGTLRLIGQPSSGQGGVAYEIWDSKDGGESWEKAAEAPDELDGRYFYRLTLSPDGSAAGVSPKSDGEEEDYEYQLYAIGADGSAKEIALQDGVKTPLYFFFGGQGELLIPGDNRVIQIDEASGEIVRSFAVESLSHAAASGQELLLFSESDVQLYDLGTGDPLAPDECLSRQLFADGDVYSIATTYGLPIVFADGGDGRMYFCTKKGIFCHVPGGSVVEEVLDGERMSLASPSNEVMGMAMDGETFYVLCVSDGSRLYRYDYSGDTPTEPGQEIRVYSLRENAEIQQTAFLYQQEHPDVLVHCEVGLTGEDGMTASDALQTLNTDILAGNGPDVLVLDGMPVSSYQEKGVLADLSKSCSAARENGELLEAMLAPWEKEGIQYAAPARFQMPVIVGETELVEKAGSLTELADVIEEGSQEGLLISPTDALVAGELLYPVCAGAWRKEDGTIDEEKLLEFISQIKRIYDSGISGINEEILSAYQEYVEMTGSVRLYFIGLTAISLMEEGTRLMYGAVNSVETLNQISSINGILGDLSYRPLLGQQSEVFIPYGLLGVNSLTDNTELALSFVEFALGEQAQEQLMGEGLPVNKSALQKALRKGEGQEDAYTTYSWGTSDGDEIGSLDVRWMKEEEILRFEEYAEGLCVAADNDTVLCDTVLEQTKRCLDGECSPEEAAGAVMQTVNLYLAEG